jgi:fructose PTS system EIIBC or EIIC component
MAFGATSRAPLGGIWVVGLIGRPGFYLFAIVAGVLVAATSVMALKTVRGTVPEADELEQGASAQVVPGNVVAA